ncbi:MAG: hypothetical protein ABIJ47_12870 [Candidatus Bathyarchaeota archaeon]
MYATDLIALCVVCYLLVAAAALWVIRTRVLVSPEVNLVEAEPVLENEALA